MNFSFGFQLKILKWKGSKIYQKNSSNNIMTEKFIIRQMRVHGKKYPTVMLLRVHFASKACKKVLISALPHLTLNINHTLSPYLPKVYKQIGRNMRRNGRN